MPEEEREERRISPALAIIPLGLGLGLLAALVAFAWAAPPGRANVYGKVTDAVTGEPIADVLVTLNGIQVYTDTEGDYAFADLEPGSYSISFEKEGYQTATY